MTGSVLLAVDDRPDNLFVLEQLLAAHLPEIKLLAAPDAEAGLKLAASEAIDGALIDVQMPGMNGIEMCRRLKGDPRTASIHVILVTAHRATPELKAQGLEAGANDFITQPIDNIELAAKLRVMLRLRAAENALCRERDHLEETVRERTQELRDAEYRYRTLFNAAADAIFINDLEGRVLEVNEEACRLLGYTREELLHLTVSDVATPEYLARRPELLKQLRTAGHLVFETEFVTRDGRIIPAESSSRMMELQGRPAVLSIARDITERKRVEANLRQSEEKFRLVFERAPIGIMHYDQTSTVTDCNEKFAEIIGAPKEKFIGFNMIRQLSEKKMREAVAASLRGEVGYYEGDYLSVTAGKLTPVRTIYQPIFSLQGVLSGGVTIFEDITERKKAEEALRESEKRNRAILRTAMDGFWRVDLQGRLLEVNEAYCRMSGYSEDELLAMRVSDLEAAETPADIATRMQKVIAQGQERFDTWHRRKDGSIFEVEVSGQHKRAEGEQVFAFLRDITDRKRAEEALRENEELYRSLFESMLNGFAYCKMLFEENRPRDFIYLAVNSSFEALTGLKNVVGKKVSEVIPGIGESDPELLKIYGRVALTGKPERVEIYVEALKMWFSLSVYSPEREYFVTVFDVITERKRTEEALKESLARITEVQYGTIEALATVTAARDPYTAGHQTRVTQLACAVAREMGLPADRVAGLRIMGLLHDMGKISIPAEILSKPGRLSDMEFNIIKSHAQAGYEIVKEIQFPWPVAQVVLQHHERLDGSGYPQGLKDDEIILEARILAVADVVEAMSSHRPYRPGLGIEAALDEISTNRGILYDADAVDACVRLFEEKRFSFAA